YIDQIVFHNPNTEDLHLMIDHLSEKIRYFLLDNQDLEQQITNLKDENDFLKEKLREAETATKLVEENKQLKAQLKSCESNHSVIAYVCLASKQKENMWYMDSGCSRHMTGKTTFFIKLDQYDGGLVTFGDDGKRKIVAVEKKLGHASMYQISKLVKKNLVRGIPKIKFDKDLACDACQLGKQVKSSFKPKDGISTKRPLEMLHIDLFGPTRTQSLGARETETVRPTEVHQSSTSQRKPREWKSMRGYPHDFIIGDPSQGVTTRSSTKRQSEPSNFALLSQLEPNNVKQALEDPSWVKAMQEELAQFDKNEVWTLVPHLDGKKVTGT
ncbi:hypothetical protein S245_019725, partial [Arachis hypogaea]